MEQAVQDVGVGSVEVWSEVEAVEVGAGGNGFVESRAFMEQSVMLKGRFSLNLLSLSLGASCPRCKMVERIDECLGTIVDVTFRARLF